MDYKQSSNKWRTISSLTTSIEYFDEADPEICVKILLVPSLRNFTGVRAKLENCTSGWMREFIELNGLNNLLEVLRRLGDRSNVRFSGALEQMECVRALKAILNSPIGLDTMVQERDLTRVLAGGKEAVVTVSFTVVFCTVRSQCQAPSCVCIAKQ